MAGQGVYGEAPDGTPVRLERVRGTDRTYVTGTTAQSGRWSLSLRPAHELALGERYRITVDGTAKEGALVLGAGWVPWGEFGGESNLASVVLGGMGNAGSVVSENVRSIVALTQEEYDELGSTSDAVLYLIVEDEESGE